MIPKFRAWDKRSKEMWKVSTLHIEDEYVDLFKKNIYENPLNDPSAKFRDVILMQSTGLKDKNGVEIFEGDVFQGPHDFGPSGFHDRRAVVNFDVEKGYQWEYWLIDKIEVIGNIYENPELLGEAE